MDTDIHFQVSKREFVCLVIANNRLVLERYFLFQKPKFATLYHFDNRLIH